MADVEEWVERLSEEDLLIVRLFWSGRRLSGFVLNYGATIDGEPVVVCRYDTCHGHRHVHHFWRIPPALVDLEDPTHSAFGYERQLLLAERDLAGRELARLPRAIGVERMKKNETDIAIPRAFANIRRQIEQGGSGLSGALQTTPEVLLAVLTPERVRLYRLVQSRREVPSVDDLARLLKRDATRVSRDIVALESIGLLITSREGKAKRIVANTRPIVLV